MKLGVIIGRFQTSFLHSGHLKLLQYVSRHNDKILVLIGTTPTPPNSKNPLDYATRAEMIHGQKSRAVVMPLMDRASDEAWSKQVDSTIESLFFGADVTLYSGRDGFISHYSGKFKTQEIQFDCDDISATDTRKFCSHHILDSNEFRHGVIYGINNIPPRTYWAVDIALVKDKQVLLGRKPGSQYLCFPGGFVDLEDQNLEAAAMRELQEETGLGSEAYPEYIGSFKIDDWRTRDHHDVKTMTALFYVPYTHGAPQAGDDLESVMMVPITREPPADLQKSHHVLWSALYVREFLC